MKNVFRSKCPIASTLDLIGDKWTLIIIRDLFFGKKIFREFCESPEKIPTNILADRLKKLEKYKLIHKSIYQTNPKRYEYHLTESGNELRSVIKVIAGWGHSHIPGTWDPHDIPEKIRD